MTPGTPFPRSEEKVSPISQHAEIPIAKLDRKDLLGKKMYDHQGIFLARLLVLSKTTPARFYPFNYALR
jgi:hypothetical protein